MMHDQDKRYPPPDYVHPPPSMISGPPPSTTVTLNTDPTPGAHVTEIHLDIGYFKTFPGILKLIQMIFGIICMACSSPARGERGSRHGIGHNHWFLFVVVTCFIITLLWSFFYFLQMRNTIRGNMPFSWLKVELYYTILATILYFIAFIVILAGFGGCAGRSGCDARIAAGAFGIFNTIAYGLGAYILKNDYDATPPELQ
ncbi:hypothetical protein TCAL_01778 [Tigriopus californicus]|uniref:MARVEL domain-containing protein n=1 Tax=Tigriopus californicus TaxID=6832 RepID=A0A553N7P9_TIGCA|nr:hypothetical protein TCAL_01778 [Tigriopus californicus]